MALGCYLLIGIILMITLRVRIASLEFLGVGWMLVLLLLPLLPWLLPRAADFVKAVSPYVERFKLGSVQIDLRAVQREPVHLPTAGVLAAVPNDYGALSSGTAITELVTALRDLRRAGGSPAGIIDLRDGRKWRLPNLYFLTRLLEAAPVVSELLFTEMRGGVDGHLVGTCSPGDLRRQVEQSVSRYGEASAGLHWPVGLDMADPAEAHRMAQSFQALLNQLQPFTAADDDVINGWVTSERIHRLLDDLLDRSSIDSRAVTLADDDLRTALLSRHQFVPLTAGGRITGLIDRDAVALGVARASLAQLERPSSSR